MPRERRVAAYVDRHNLWKMAWTTDASGSMSYCLDIKLALLVRSYYTAARQWMYMCECDIRQILSPEVYPICWTMDSLDGPRLLPHQHDYGITLGT